MQEADHPPPASLADRLAAWRNRLVASPRFQSLAARLPLAARIARKDGERLYDLVAGFVYSQVLLACVELDLLAATAERARSPADLALKAGIPPERMETLLQSAAAIGLMTRTRDGRFRLGRLGAAVLGVPGLAAMIRHHRDFYADLSDPVALMRGETDPAMARLWSYVRGGQGVDPATARIYSELMRESQALVAEETLRTVDLSRARHIMDVGGGTGAFLTAVAATWSGPRMTLFDLPPVAEVAAERIAAAGLSGRISAVGGSFRDDPLPAGADTITLVRVLYDHDDTTVQVLLKAVHAALPPGGLVVLSEPMSGGARPSRSGDAYFGFYTMAMTTGRPRSPARHAALLAQAGFTGIRHLRTARPYLTDCVSATRNSGGS